jgi:NADPH-dependent glutamate synthase beta subunit-like oxidoreductase
LPLGYEVTIFEALATTGGLMRTNIPQFRLPPKVLDEEIGYIVDMGAEVKLNHRIESLKELLDSDAWSVEQRAAVGFATDWQAVRRGNRPAYWRCD